MRPSVAQALQSFLARFEGDALDFMYADTMNLVTTGTGNKIDDGPRYSTAITMGYAAPALLLPWRHRGTRERATQQEIFAAWGKVKSRSDMGARGGGTYAGETDLYLDKAALAELFADRARLDEAHLRQRFPSFEAWPADAQLGLLSMSWAMGPAFKFPKFQAAANAGDFLAAARESHSYNTAPERNAANAQLFTNAAEVLATGADPSIVYWPGRVGAAGGGGGLGGAGTSTLLGGALGAIVGAGAIGFLTWWGLTKWGMRA